MGIVVFQCLYIQRIPHSSLESINSHSTFNRNLPSSTHVTFGKEVVLECRESILSETFHTEMTQVQCGLTSVALKKMDILASENPDTGILPQFWGAIVESYTS